MFKMSLKRVLIVNKTYPTAGLEWMKNRVEPTVLPYKDYDEDSLPAIKRSIKGYDALVWNTKHKLTKEILDIAGPQLKVVTTISSGMDHVDIEEIRARGIALGNSPKAQNDAVADITVGLLIAAARRFKEGVDDVRNGTWTFGVNWTLGQEIAGSTVGIVGLGGVGQAVARRLKGFSVAKIIYSGNSDKPEAKSLGAERVTLEQLLSESDFVLLCCPLTDKTSNMINADTLSTMKTNCVLVNIGRGGLIDHDALYDALSEGRIFAAGLDVTNPEPLPKDHKLVALPNCYIIPHMGSATIQTRDKMACIAANNIIAGLEGRPMECPVYQPF